MRYQVHLFAVALSLSACASVQTTLTGQEEVSIAPVAEAPQKPKRNLVGYLGKPEGAGPFPAVVLMHGCGGLELDTRHQTGFNYLSDFAREYRRMGFVTLVLDSYGPRGLGDICAGVAANGGPNGVLNQDDRAYDVFAAIRYFDKLGYVDTKRVVAHGFSHGGMAALSAIDQPHPVPEKVAAVVAYYPGCRPTGKHSAPSLILIGGNDGWTPASYCQFMAQSVETTKVKVYPGVYHSFAIPVPDRQLLGNKLAFNAEAAADSWMEIRAFLALHRLVAAPN